MLQKSSRKGSETFTKIFEQQDNNKLVTTLSGDGTKNIVNITELQTKGKMKAEELQKNKLTKKVSSLKH